MKPIRLLIWCPLVNPGGGARLLMRLISALAVRPDIARISLVVPRGSILPEQLDAAARAKIQWCEFDRPVPPRIFRRIWNRLWVRPVLPPSHRKLKEHVEDCDVVYAFWPHRNDFPAIPRPVVCTFQDAIFFDFPEILGSVGTQDEWTRASRWLRESAQVVVSSLATKDALKRHFDFPPEKLALVHHAIMPTNPESSVDLPPSCAAALPPRYFICPAPLTTHKNHCNLLSAWARWPEHKQYPLVLVGNCTHLIDFKPGKWPRVGDSTRVAGLIQRLGLRPGIDYFPLGYVPDEDIPRLIRRAVALIMPTMAEGGGSYPVEEALRLGVPVLCSDIPVLREHVEGRTAPIGWFDPESPASILAAVRELLATYEDRQRAAVAGMNDPRPTWDDVAAGYAEIFMRVAQERANGRS